MGGQSLYYGMNALSHNVIMADRKRLKAPKGLYCIGRSYDRNLQAVLFVAAQQMDGHPQEKGSGTASGAKRERQPPQEHFTPAYVVKNCRVKSQNLFEKSSVLPPHFLLLVEGHSRRLDKSDYALKNQERSSQTYCTPYQPTIQYRKEPRPCRPLQQTETRPAGEWKRLISKKGLAPRFTPCPSISAGQAGKP